MEMFELSEILGNASGSSRNLGKGFKTHSEPGKALIPVTTSEGRRHKKESGMVLGLSDNLGSP